MIEIFLKKIAVYFFNKYASEAIEYGAKALVKSTDNGIDDEILNIFLDEAVKSKRNKLGQNIKDKLINQIGLK